MKAFVPATKAPDMAVKKVNPANVCTPIFRDFGIGTCGVFVNTGGTVRDMAVQRMPKYITNAEPRCVASLIRKLVLKVMEVKSE